MRRKAATYRMEIPMPKPAKKHAKASSQSITARNRGAKPSHLAAARSNVSKNDATSKQARVIVMLQSPAGATISAVTHETGWQQHSVRGFLAGVVRKKLKLKLESNKVGGHRIYRIRREGRSKARGPQSERRAA